MAIQNVISLVTAAVIFCVSSPFTYHSPVIANTTIEAASDSNAVMVEATNSNASIATSSEAEYVEVEEMRFNFLNVYVTNKNGSNTYKVGDIVILSSSTNSPWNISYASISVDDIKVVEGYDVLMGGLDFDYKIPPEFEGKEVTIYGYMEVFNGDEGYGWEDEGRGGMKVYTTPPQVTKNPLNTLLKVGEKAEFKASFSGKFLSYQWYKDGIAIPEATKDSYAFTVTSKDGGNYTCKAANTGGNITTNNAKLTLQVTASFQGNGGTDGISITKPCGTALGTLPASTRAGYQLKGWYTQAANGVLINSNTMMPESDVVYYAQWNDTTKPIIGDVYTVKDENSGYWVYVQAYDNEDGIYFVSCPSWTEENGQDDMETYWDEYPNSVAAEATGGGWYRYFVDRRGHNNEYGTYITHCYAFDYKGNRSESKQLTVYFDKPPTITSQPSNFHGDIGDVFEVAVICEGDNLMYQWYVTDSSVPSDGLLLHMVTGPAYSNRASLEDNNTYYYCIISNSSGTVTTNTAKISIDYPMMNVSIPISMFLAINPNGNDSLPFLSIKNNSKLPVNVSVESITGDEMMIVAKDEKHWERLGIEESKKYISFSIGNNWIGNLEEGNRQLAALKKGETFTGQLDVKHGYSFIRNKSERFSVIFRIDYQL